MKITQAVHGGSAYFVVESRSGLTLILSEVGAGIYDCLYKGRHLVETPRDHDIYERSTGYYGKSVGRVAGRLKGGILSFEGKEYLLEQNNGNNCLHGGTSGFAFKKWRSDIELLEKGTCRVDFYLTSPDGEGGFPGELTVRVRYLLSDVEPTFRIETKAVAKGDSLLSFTNHSYWNLNGEGTIEEHELAIRSHEAMMYGEGLIPLGYADVSPALDFAEGKKIGQDLHDPEILDGVTGGYDHSFKFDTKDERDRVVLKGQDLELHISTSFPGVQVYTDNFGVAGLPLNRGGSWERFGAVALEPSFSPLDVNDYAIRDGATQRAFIEYRLEERK